MFDFMPDLSNVFEYDDSQRAVMRTSRGLERGVILSDKTLFIFSWLSSYKFDGGLIGYSIDMQKFLIEYRIV